MKNFAILIIASVAAMAASAQTVGQWYGEASYQMQTLTDKSDDQLGKFKTNNISLGVGRVMMNNLAVEGFYQLPSSTATNTYPGPATIDLKFASGYGFALKPFVNLGNQFELFGRLGRIHGESDYTAKDAKGTETGTNKITKNFYGVGVVYKVTPTISVVADYKKVTGISDSSVSMNSIGLRYNF